MQTYIALLRGINVGGHKKVPMAELREILTTTKLENVKTYIQSGNIIFQSSESNTYKLEHTIKKSILAHFGFEIPILVKTREELNSIFEACPFSEEKKMNSYFTLLSAMPDKDLVVEASKKIYLNEEYLISNNCIYFYSEKGYGNAKFNLSFFEKKLKISATSRNYKTMVKLLALSIEKE